MKALSAAAHRLVVMGPSGCGKSTLARALAQTLQWRFLEGDELHPPANVGKMRSGQPLDDADRSPWLDAVGRALCAETTRGVVVTCSALKRQYRDQLRATADPLQFILPCVSREELARRLSARTGHFMPANLLDSQLADLEPFQPYEAGIAIDGEAQLPVQVEFIRSRLGL